MDLNIKKLTQLNEKVLVSGVEKYNILYPETIATQVITDALHRFVTDAQIARWDNGGTYGLCYRGVFSTAGWTDSQGNTHNYSKNDVVYYLPADWTDNSSGRYFISIADDHVQVPSMIGNTSYWRNINLSSYIATNANKVKNTALTGSGTLYFTGVDNINVSEASKYDELKFNSGIYYTIADSTLHATNITATEFTGHLTGNVTGDVTGNLTGNVTGNVTGDVTGNLDGIADRADKYTVWASYQNTDPTARHYTTDTTKVGKVDREDPERSTTSNYIDDTIREIQSGSTTVVLAHPLTLQKDGVTDQTYNNTSNITFNVKQTYAPADITNLLDTNNKIKESWLPDSIIGQLEYKGIWNPSLQATGVTAKKGWYYIAATANGNYAPDGTLMTPTASTEPPFFLIGDWAVYNGTGWDKIDNTDAVTSVNSRIGAVQTYQVYTSGQHYYRGDIVKVNSVLYIANQEVESAASTIDENYWDIFGRTYTASDAIKIDGTTIKHDVTMQADTTSSATISAGQTFQVPSITRDAYGHTTKIDVKTITLNSDLTDTWRSVSHYDTDGTLHNDLVGKDNKKLVFDGDTWINFNYTNDRLTVTHKNIDAIPDLNSGKITDSQATDDILYAGQGYTVPNVTVDAAGHITVGSLKRFRLADTSFTHSHFNITTSNNVNNIEAFSAAIATSTWVNTASNANKFYLGTVDPVNTTRMNINAAFHATELYQGENKKVVDETLRFYAGKNASDTDLYGTYNKTTGILNAPDSGAGAGVYSAVKVNAKGIVTAGGQIIEFGTVIDADPSAALAVGGLFFRLQGIITE